MPFSKTRERCRDARIREMAAKPKDKMSRERVLVVDDEKLIRWSIRSGLEELGYVVGEAGSGADLFRLLEDDDWDLMILDHRLPDMTGLDILERVRPETPEMAVVMMTAYGTVENAVQAMKFGAFDYLTKPVNIEELVLIVQKALETTQLRREVRRLRSEQRELHGNTQIVGSGPAISEVLELVNKVCASQATTILLEGESGTGKNVVAKAIHYGSPRADRPFMNITCSAVTGGPAGERAVRARAGSLHRREDARRRGLLEVADGGTAFLDEIGEMGPSMQAKLLRFLEEKMRSGGSAALKRYLGWTCVIIAATNRVLEDDGPLREVPRGPVLPAAGHPDPDHPAAARAAR